MSAVAPTDRGALGGVPVLPEEPVLPSEPVEPEDVEPLEPESATPVEPESEPVPVAPLEPDAVEVESEAAPVEPEAVEPEAVEPVEPEPSEVDDAELELPLELDAELAVDAPPLEAVDTGPPELPEGPTLPEAPDDPAVLPEGASPPPHAETAPHRTARINQLRAPRVMRRLRRERHFLPSTLYRLRPKYWATRIGGGPPPAALDRDRGGPPMRSKDDLRRELDAQR
jgi:hypothetical protein